MEVIFGCVCDREVHDGSIQWKRLGSVGVSLRVLTRTQARLSENLTDQQILAQYALFLRPQDFLWNQKFFTT